MLDAPHYRTALVLERSRHVTLKATDKPLSPLGFGKSTPIAEGQSASPTNEATGDAAPSAARSPSLAADATRRPIEPMLLVHQERMETFRILARLVRRGLRAIGARFTAARGDGVQTPFFIALLSMLILVSEPRLVTAQEFSSAALSVTQRASYEQAVQSFRARRYSDAYGRFARLADAGHVPSAQLALVMYQNGLTLFESNWSASTSQQQRWQALVANSTRANFVSDDRGD